MPFRLQTKHAAWAAGILLAAPGLYQLFLLSFTVGARFDYPYDLEWMEGGLLTHALRLQDGHSLYEAPSVDFIPYLYTPLYPMALATLGTVFDVGYQLGRAVSVASLFGILLLTLSAVVRASANTGTKWILGILACGYFAATYPWFEGWYDLVRADTFFWFLGLSGLYGLIRWGKQPGTRFHGFWHGPIFGCALILGISFFAKQTGVLLVVAGGGLLLVMNRRALPLYTLCTGVVGLGGSALLNKATHGWFWIYVFEYHQQHEAPFRDPAPTNRFWASFGHMLGEFPVLTTVIAAALLAVIAHGIKARALTTAGRAFSSWFFLLLCGLLIGALGFSTPWAHFNAYIPAMSLAAIAAAIGVVAINEVFSFHLPKVSTRPWLTSILTLLLGIELVAAHWSPQPFIPTPADRQAGDRLIARLRDVPGDVFIPFHPFYAHLAGKKTHTHRMGILDVTYRPPAKRKVKKLRKEAHRVDGLADAIQNRLFDLIVLDNRARNHEIPLLRNNYYLQTTLPKTERPRVFTGAKTVPKAVYAPKPKPATGASSKQP